MPLLAGLAAARSRLVAAQQPLRRAMSTTTQSYTERMDKTGRPISPHLWIYRFPTIAISSIMVRITGVMLTAGTTGIAFMALGDSNKPAEFASSLASSSLAFPAKLAVGFPLTYHFLGACRHIAWDKTGKGFTNAQMLHSSYALAGASAVLSLGLAMTTLPPKKSDK